MRSEELEAFIYCSKFQSVKGVKAIFQHTIDHSCSRPEACKCPLHIIWKVFQMIELQL